MSPAERTRRKPTERRSERDRRLIEVAAARFYRRARGRITRKDARDLGRLYGGDLHWRFMGSMADKLALREPTRTEPCSVCEGGLCMLCDDLGRVPVEGSFLRAWREHLSLAFAFERRAPRRWSTSDYAGPETARHFGYFFGWLGPRSGIWPGDRLAWDPSFDDVIGRERGWRVACAPDCPCGRCWRPGVST